MLTAVSATYCTARSPCIARDRHAEPQRVGLACGVAPVRHGAGHRLGIQKRPASRPVTEHLAIRGLRLNLLLRFFIRGRYLSACCQLLHILASLAGGASTWRRCAAITISRCGPAAQRTGRSRDLCSAIAPIIGVRPGLLPTTLWPQRRRWWQSRALRRHNRGRAGWRWVSVGSPRSLRVGLSMP